MVCNFSNSFEITFLNIKKLYLRHGFSRNEGLSNCCGSLSTLLKTITKAPKHKNFVAECPGYLIYDLEKCTVLL
jgi:hypothetical protein